MNSIVIEILVQRKKENLNIFKLFEVSSEDIQHIRALLGQTSIQNTEISLQCNPGIWQG